MSPNHVTPGNGVLLFFRVDDFDLALQRARGSFSAPRGATYQSEYSEEFSVRDPDGYYVTISGL
jgi:hypothetical protein